MQEESKRNRGRPLNGKPRRPRGRPEKLIPPIPGPFENVIKALVQPIKRTGKS